MATIDPVVAFAPPHSLPTRMRQALGAEEAGLALFVGFAICLFIAALAVGTVAPPVDLDQAALASP